MITNSETAEPAPEPVATSATPPEPQTPPEQPVQSAVAPPQVTAQQQADVPSPSQSQPQVVTGTAQSVMSPSQTAPMIQYGQMQYAQAIPNQFSAPSQQVPVATPLPAQNSVQPQSLSSPPAIPPSQPVAAVNYQLTQQTSVQNNQNTLQ